ncbi:MAG TPA: GNAT family N-acetyltransferase [Allosphingosinicella sp.]|jgi:GNAT superfamily N-acetyltransferase
MSAEEAYRLAPLAMSGDGFERVSALLRRVFPRARHLTPGYLAWQYSRNPDGEAVGFSAYAGDALVGHLAGVALSARIEGEIRRGLLLVNSAVHADHRRRSLMSRLSEAIFAEGAVRGYSFSISTGNRYSSKPLLTRYQPIGPLEARIGIGRSRRAAMPAPASFERIWSEEALRWRLANPERRYCVRRRGGQLSISAATGLPGVAALLYQGAGEAPPTAGSAPGPLGLWLGRDPGIAWRRSSFLPIPERLRPSPLNLFFRDLTGGGFVPDPDRLIFQALDFDAY